MLLARPVLYFTPYWAVFVIRKRASIWGEKFMSIRLAVSHAAAGVFAACLVFAGSGEALAQANVLKECGTKYQATKAAGELKGQSWQDFLKKCREGLAEPAKTETPAAEAPAPTPPPPVKAEAPKVEPPKAEIKTETPKEPAKPTAAAPAKPKSEGQAAMHARQKACGAEWKAKKAELKKSDPTIKWPKFWSECNTRLKSAQ
jgi:type IV secretory pathway VirB10-like protein